MQLLDVICAGGRQTIAISVAVLSAGFLSGCANTGPQVTHHWVSQDKVAGNTYRSDVAACSQGSSELNANSSEFAAYQTCMKDRGYALVAANELDQAETEQPVNTRY